MLVIHSEDDQIVPYADSGPLSAKLLKNGTLKSYKDLPHGCAQTHPEIVNADLLAFVKRGKATSRQWRKQRSTCIWKPQRRHGWGALAGGRAGPSSPHRAARRGAMLLAIDAGNTNLVFALVEGSAEIKARWRIATDPRRTADEYAVWLHQLLELEGYGRGDVDRVIIGTVVPRALHNLEVLSCKYFGVKPLVAGQGEADWPIAFDVEEPQSVGADRALNAMAAHAKHQTT